MEDLFGGVLPFFHTAETLSFRKAGEALGVSTAAVSKAVQRLEERLGVKLLVRTSRSVALTPEGATYLERCREAIGSLRAGRELMSHAQGQPRGEIVVTLSFVFGRLVIPALPTLTARYPHLGVRLVMRDDVARVAAENLDLAVRIGARADSTLVSHHLLSPRWITVASPAWIARHGAPATPDALVANAVRFVGPDGRDRRWTFLDPDTGTFVRREVTGSVRLDHGEQLVDAAVAGVGVVQVLDFMVVDALREGRLARVLAAYEAPGPPIHAVSTPERARTPNVRAFLGFLDDVFRLSGGGAPAPLRSRSSGA